MLSILAAVACGLVLVYAVKSFMRPANAPPYIRSIPWLGAIVQFGEHPINFLKKCYDENGPVFSFTMFGSEVTYLLGSDASNQFWISKNDDLNAEDMYKNITVPVFGKGVAFDVEHRIFSDQKRIAKTGLTKARFERYTSLIEHETATYIKETWKKDEGTVDLFVDLAEMIVFTATRCLHGKEVRDRFDAAIAELYSDLDGGFTPLAWLAPPWIPFPSFVKRDKAHIALKARFKEAIDARRAQMDSEDNTDILQTLLTTRYNERINSGRSLNEDEISGLLIALLMAGQHTSSTTSSWFGFYVMSIPGLQDQLYQEQIDVLGKNCTRNITIADLDKMPLLHSCLRETLRLKPPIMQLMRKCRKPLTIKLQDGKEYVIPKGNQVVVSPSMNGLLDEEWDNAAEFQPRRFIDPETGTVTDGSHIEKGGKYKWVPFGAGRHRCIGYEFAQIQIRCIWSYMIRNFEFSIPDGKVPATNFRTMIHTPLDASMHYKRRKA